MIDLSISQIERRTACEIKKQLENENIIVYLIDLKVLKEKNSYRIYIAYSFTKKNWETKIFLYNQGMLLEGTYDKKSSLFRNEFNWGSQIDDLLKEIRLDYKHHFNQNKEE